MLTPIFHEDEAPAWPGATWIGEVDLRLLAEDRIPIAESQGFPRARLAIRSPSGIVGLEDFTVEDGFALVSSASRQRWLPLLAQDCGASSGLLRPISVVVCTYDRPDSLPLCLGSLARLKYPQIEVVVVDNHPQSGVTKKVIEDHDFRVRIIDEPAAGLSRARNVGLAEASYEIVAFTDDDVIVDPDWLLRIGIKFEEDASVACVSGLVLTGELRSPSQAYFDGRVDWGSRFVSEIFDVRTPPSAEPLFPFQVGRFGTGANFAVRRSFAIELGGFDECLGAGTLCASGEDSDFFFRTLMKGYRVAFEPSAITWHRHRRSVDELAKQMKGYGLGIGAFMAKRFFSPRSLLMLMTRLPRLAAKVRRYGSVANESRAYAEVDGIKLSTVERAGLFTGPLALLRMKLAGAKASPFRGDQAALIERRATYRSVPMRRPALAGRHVPT